MSHEFTVKKSERGQALETFLHRKLGTWSHREIKNAANQQCVFVNGHNVFIGKWNLKPGDCVKLIPKKQGTSSMSGGGDGGRYHYVDVLFEDPYLLITNKRAFVDYDSFVGHVNAYLRRTHGKNFYPYVGQMHRLDKETSGILVFTKKKSANILSEQFRNRALKKEYLAVVEGRVGTDHGVIDEPLEKKKFEGGKKVQISRGPHGKESITEYWVEERYDHATLLRVHLKTGRTHQIRVHLSSIGHPLLGDKIYGVQSKIQNQKSKQIDRQALHAHRLELTHPFTQQKMKITAPLPDDFKNLLDELRLAT